MPQGILTMLWRPLNLPHPEISAQTAAYLKIEENKRIKMLAAIFFFVGTLLIFHSFIFKMSHITTWVEREVVV